MKRIRFFIAAVVLLFCNVLSFGKNNCIVVADSATHHPLPNASVFNNKGLFIGTSKANGNISCASNADFPITIRYLGYWEQTIPSANADTIFLRENIAELPEVVIGSKQHKILHLLAYVREYATLSSYTDTVTMFREKMVDYMIPNDAKVRFKGWKMPRTLNSRSYYQFTNAYGLDSVSDRCGYHFSWSDWISVLPSIILPMKLRTVAQGCDTVAGIYSPSEIWVKKDNKLTIDINVLADTISRKWVPNISYFFRKGDTDFEQFRLHLNYDYAIGPEITPLDLSGFSFNIESRGRGRDMFLFNHQNQPFFVTTYTEVYILDKEFISVKEAKQWDQLKVPEEIALIEPMEAPELQPATLALIDRVNSIDGDQVRLTLKPDYKLVNPNQHKNNDNFGHRAFTLLKQLTGISHLKFHRNFNNNWKEDRRKQIEHNLQSPSPAN